MEYGYVNARVRGMKSRLLDKKGFEALIFKPDVDGLIAELEKTPYRDDIIGAKARISGTACVEEALRNNLARTYRKIAMFVAGTEAEGYLGIFFRRWDVQNIKTILRGKVIHTTPEDIQSCLVAAGALDDVTLNEMIRQPDIRAIIDLLATWEIDFFRPLTEAYPEYAKNEDLIVLECALDRFYYNEALGKVAGSTPDEVLIRALLRTEIDTINVKTLFRMTRDHIAPGEAARFFLEGGEEFEPARCGTILERQSVEGVLEELQPTSFRFLSSLSDTYARSGKISVFEKELDRNLVRNGVRAFFAYPLSIAPAVGYFWAKLNEVTNIRIISRCKTAALSDAELAEELIYV